MVPESNDITKAAPPSAASPSAPHRSETADAAEPGEIGPPDAPQEAGNAIPTNGSHPEPEARDSADKSAPADRESAPAAAAPTGEKKRRRRRRGKKSHADGAVAKPDANAAEGAPEVADEPSATPAEGGEAIAEDESKPKSGKKQARDKRGKGKKPRGARPESAHPRERTAFHVGEEVFGRVTSVTEDAVMVDLSGKALAIFDRHELAEDDLVPDVGDRFVAHVHGDGSRGGFVVLTRKPLREEETKPRLEEASKSGDAVWGLVTGTVKGGLEIDIDGVRAFAPGSHVDLRPGADLAHLIGRRLEFTVAQYAKRGRDVVVSRKSYIEAEAKEQRKASLAKLEAGSVVKGVVKSVVQYGAFVAIPSADDVEGLVHMTEASHDRNAKLSDVFQVGAEIDVKILRVDEKGKLWLSHKAAVTDPWHEAMKTFSQGTRHKGKVLRLLPFGAFIELAPGDRKSVV